MFKMWFSVLILSCEHSNEDLKWRALLSRWNLLTCDHSNESHRALLQSYCLLCCTSWFEILSLWMNSLSVTCSQVKASDQYFSLLLSAVGGGSNVWVFMKSRCNSNASPIQVHCLNTPRCRGFTYYREPCIQYTWYNRNMNSIMHRFTY